MANPANPAALNPPDGELEVRNISSDAAMPCPITTLLDVLSAKWVVEILRELAIRPTRTTHFIAHIPGLSMKVLRERLSMLEENGVIRRVEVAGPPLKVEYSVTERGRRLFYVLVELKAVADDWARDRCCTCSFETSCNGEGVVDCHRRRARVRSFEPLP